MSTSRLLLAASLGAAGLLLLAGCSTPDGAAVPAAGTAQTSTPSPSVASTPPSLTTSTPTTTAPAATSSSTAAPAPSASRAGRPPAPPFVTTSSDTVPGLTAAIATPSHPGLAVCEGHFASILVTTGDLRGNGGTQYLVDTTCQGATASTPDEIAIYEKDGAGLTRSAVVYTFTANRPRITTQPYLDGAHTIVLTYDEGARYSLVTVTPTGIVQGELRAS